MQTRLIRLRLWLGIWTKDAGIKWMDNVCCCWSGKAASKSLEIFIRKIIVSIGISDYRIDVRQFLAFMSLGLNGLK